MVNIIIYVSNNNVCLWADIKLTWYKMIYRLSALFMLVCACLGVCVGEIFCHMFNVATGISCQIRTVQEHKSSIEKPYLHKDKSILRKVHCHTSKVQCILDKCESNHFSQILYADDSYAGEKMTPFSIHQKSMTCESVGL